MGIDVRVESESGDVIAEVGDPHGWTNSLLPTSSHTAWYCLRFVDPYGDAVFNQSQVPILIRELRLQLDKILDPSRREHADAILRLVESAQGKVHTYVRFVGD